MTWLITTINCKPQFGLRANLICLTNPSQNFSQAVLDLIGLQGILTRKKFQFESQGRGTIECQSSVAF